MAFPHGTRMNREVVKGQIQGLERKTVPSLIPGHSFSFLHIHKLLTGLLRQPQPCSQGSSLSWVCRVALVLSQSCPRQHPEKREETEHWLGRCQQVPGCWQLRWFPWGARLPAAEEKLLLPSLLHPSWTGVPWLCWNEKTKDIKRRWWGAGVVSVVVKGIFVPRTGGVSSLSQSPQRRWPVLLSLWGTSAGALPPSHPLPCSLLRSTAARGWPGWYQPDLERMQSPRVLGWGPEARCKPQVTELVNRAPGSAHFLLLGGRACLWTGGATKTPELGPGPGRGQSLRRQGGRNQGGRNQGRMRGGRSLQQPPSSPRAAPRAACPWPHPALLFPVWPSSLWYDCALTSLCLFHPPLAQTKNSLFFYLVFLIFWS